MTSMQMMPVDLLQNTDEWLQWRRGGIGASDVPTILGRNPWKTAYRLWQEKVGIIEPEDLSNNPRVQRGNQYEDEARVLFENRYKVFAMAMCGQGIGDNAHVRVSYDGLFNQGDRVINLEIKCPGDKKLQSLQEKLAAATLAPSDSIQVRNDGAQVTREGLEKLGFGHYWDQTQYQMMLANAGLTCLWIYNVNTKEGTALWIYADSDSWGEMMNAVNAFWMNVVEQNAPELDPDRDVLTADALDEESKQAFLAAEIQYLNAEKELKALKAQMDSVEETMAAARETMTAQMGNYGRAEGAHGAKVARFYRKGNIDWKKAFNEVAPDFDENALESFRKPGADTVRVTTKSAARLH